jgi:anti-anti-sigma factor
VSVLMATRRDSTRASTTVPLGSRASVTIDGERVHVAGELDALSAPRLTTILDALVSPPEVIDCRAVTFIGAAGVTSLVIAAERHRFVTVGSPAVRRLLTLCGLAESLGLVEPVETNVPADVSRPSA